MEINMEESAIHRSLIEAALFMSPKPLTMDDLMKATGIGSLGYLKETLRDLQKDYTEKGLEIAENSEGWHMKVKKEYLPRVAHLTPNADLSEGCKKALALIIYKEPFKQSDLIKIQGTKAYEYSRELEKRGLIRREKAGHTKILKVTAGLENYFGETKEQIKKRIHLAMEGWEPKSGSIDTNDSSEKQTTIDEYPKDSSSKSAPDIEKKADKKKKAVSNESEIKKEISRHLENALEDDIRVKEPMTVDDEFSTEPPINRIVKQNNLKPLRREKPVKIKLAKHAKEESVPEMKGSKEDSDEASKDKKIRKSAGLTGIKELTLEDLR